MKVDAIDSEDAGGGFAVDSDCYLASFLADSIIWATSAAGVSLSIVR